MALSKEDRDKLDKPRSGLSEEELQARIKGEFLPHQHNEMVEVYQRDLLDKALANLKLSAGRGNIRSYLKSAEYELALVRNAVDALETLKLPVEEKK